MLIEKIEELFSLIEKKNALEKNLKSIKDDSVKLESEKKEILASKYLKENTLKELKKSVDLCELEINDLVSREKSLKGRLSSLVRQREIDASKQEIVVIQSHREEVEEDLLKNLDEISRVTKALEQDSVTFQDFENEFDQKAKILFDFENTIKKELSPINEAISEIFELFPEEFKNKYQRIISRVANPIVAISNGACSVCYSTITPQELNELKFKKIGECKNCGRVLFFVQN